MNNSSPGFNLKRINADGIRIVIVESMNDLP